MAQMGMNKAQIEAQLQRREAEETIWIYPDNWPTVRLFLAMQTQWRIGMSGATGLDYSALPVVAEALRIRLKPSRFTGLQLMEREMLSVWAERSAATE